MNKIVLSPDAGRDLLVGGAAALIIGGLGWLVAASVVPQHADAAERVFGTLLTLLFGIVSAIWWGQSATLSNLQIDEEAPQERLQKDANILNGGAATFTALTLFASVFASSAWKSTGSWLCGLGTLLLLLMSGGELRRAVPISLRQHLQLREFIGLAGITLAIAIFFWHLVT